MESLIQSLSLWGYLLVFGIVFFECAGLPLPGFSVAVLAAALAGHGHFNIWLVFVSTASATILGGMAGYWIGSNGGRGLVERYGRYVLITPQRFSTAETLFHKHGNKAILFGRYLPLLCFLGGVLAGIARLPYRSFFINNLAGALLWCATQLTLGFVCGRSIKVLFETMNNVILIVAIGAVVAALFMYVRRKLRSSRPISKPLQITIDDPVEGR